MLKNILAGLLILLFGSGCWMAGILKSDPETQTSPAVEETTTEASEEAAPTSTAQTTEAQTTGAVTSPGSGTSNNTTQTVTTPAAILIIRGEIESP